MSVVFPAEAIGHATMEILLVESKHEDPDTTWADGVKGRRYTIGQRRESGVHEIFS